MNKKNLLDSSFIYLWKWIEKHTCSYECENDAKFELCRIAEKAGVSKELILGKKNHR